MSTLYEENVKRMLEEKKRRLEELIASIEEMEKLNAQGYDDNNIMDEDKRSSNARDNTINKIREEIYRLEHEIHVLEMLYENYSSSMGAFRRTKGARKIR
jgi:predicted RNase H-like nuclease (RuvC/YqgF family)